MNGTISLWYIAFLDKYTNIRGYIPIYWDIYDSGD